VPIYEYQCSQCGEVFEVFQKITDEPLVQCRFCRGRVEKLISHSSFQLKGSGWYLTDYARRNSSASSDKPSTGEGTDKKDGSKTATDSKGSEKSDISKT
jgi:putative FmdB family regulatory protein